MQGPKYPFEALKFHCICLFFHTPIYNRWNQTYYTLLVEKIGLFDDENTTPSRWIRKISFKNIGFLMCLWSIYGHSIVLTIFVCYLFSISHPALIRNTRFSGHNFIIDVCTRMPLSQYSSLVLVYMCMYESKREVLNVVLCVVFR